MEYLWDAYWPLIVGALLIGLIAGWIALRPRQRVTLSHDAAPLRPHMTVDSAAGDGPEGNGVDDNAAAAIADVSGMILGSDVHGELPGAGSAEGDDLTRMKGVGPKLSALLRAEGFGSFGRLAALDEAELAALDERLGAFKGRLARDRVVEQARLLAAGDQAGYEARFGKL